MSDFGRGKELDVGKALCLLIQAELAWSMAFVQV